jgi:hypothetical protein
LDLIPMAHQICSNFKSIATCSSLVTCWCIFIKSHNWLKFLIDNLVEIQKQTTNNAKFYNGTWK